MIYVVLSHPTETRCWVKDPSTLVPLKEICDTFVKYLIILENGVNEDNPHYNIIFETKTIQANTTYMRTKFKTYYSKNGYQGEYGKNLLKLKMVDNIETLLLYVHKEPNCSLIGYNGIYEDRLDFGWYKSKSAENSLKIKGNMKKACLTIISKSSMYEFLANHIYENKLHIQSYSDFVEMMVDLREKNIVIPELMHRPGHVYAMICKGNDDALDFFRKIYFNNANLN